MAHSGRSRRPRRALPRKRRLRIDRPRTDGAARPVYERKGGHAASKALGRHRVVPLRGFTSKCTRATLTWLRQRSSTRWLDAIEAALAPSAVTGVQNVGLPAMVHTPTLPEVGTDGASSGQAIAILPIEICASDHASNTALGGGSTARSLGRWRGFER